MTDAACAGALAGSIFSKLEEAIPKDKIAGTVPAKREKNDERQ